VTRLADERQELLELLVGLECVAPQFVGRADRVRARRLPDQFLQRQQILAATPVVARPASPAAAATTGTGGGASGGGAAGSTDVCKLLSAAQASTIVGVHYASAQSSPNMCNYTTTNAPIGMFIIIFHGGSDAAWHSELGTLEEDGGAKPATISGVGSRAAAAGLELGVLDGNQIIDIHGGDPNGTGSKFPKSIALAKAVISALH